MNESVKRLQKIFAENQKGIRSGIYSICSAHPMVLKASMLQAKTEDSLLLIESTSNQVDQFGGYTGMNPKDFAAFVHTLAEQTGFPSESLILGGDHLGPNTWQDLTAEKAMKQACNLVAAYIKAGYKKIHLDASMFCADDAGDRSKPLDDTVVAKRAAELCRTAEEAWRSCRSGEAAPLYIIGTEVPIPGGAREEEEGVTPTSPEHASKTIEITKSAFFDRGLEEAWNRVVGLVVQPGVEFGDDQVFHYNSAAASSLSGLIKQHDNLVYEAHSTDYQSETDLSNLVKDHFCILKVGPWLTFAYREALFALEAMERELLGNTHSCLREKLDSVMLKQPKHWEKYYHGTEEQQRFKRKYSFSDRSRYYWSDKELVKAVNTLMKNLSREPVPLSLLSQFMPRQFDAVQEGLISRSPEDLIIFGIREVLKIYSRACGLS
ncbi:MAG: D-tagatose-bisphosphate aldolase, class II, non-catalytic subunit [Spirochaetales bacterium]|jgi:D-tagatose-1,6-bisphosphate aldolase subunit GatZ/KbaZ|nr:D-tagatose-bisphosphate aldolase, class II, non-catalytic subunit [Spirochaetales bacterium]